MARIRITDEFRHAPDGIEGKTAFYQPGEYEVKEKPAAGEFALTQDVAAAAIQAGKAEEIVEAPAEA